MCKQSCHSSSFCVSVFLCLVRRCRAKHVGLEWMGLDGMVIIGQWYSRASSVLLKIHALLIHYISIGKQALDLERLQFKYTPILTSEQIHNT